MKTNEYWTARNALVDAVKRAAPRFVEENDASVWRNYAKALAELRSFDEAHGGAPVL